MMYVALLRGINIGGRNKSDMKTLKQSFETAGITDVVTYINSGNIIFTNKDLSAVELAETLEAVILKDFYLDIKVLLRSKTDIEHVMDFLPDNWRNRSEEHTSELQSRFDLVCRLLLEIKKTHTINYIKKTHRATHTPTTL